MARAFLQALLNALLRPCEGGYTDAPVPQGAQYAPGHPDTCPGCREAVDAVLNRGHRACLCPDARCGQWWTSTEHAYLYRANIETMRGLDARH